MLRSVVALLAVALLPGCLATTGDGGSYIREPILYDDDRGWNGWGAPPGWGNHGWGNSGWGYAPRSRYSRTSPEVVCDSRTELCYKRGHVDTSETRDAFGRGAARDADALRDRLGTSHVYVPRNSGDSYCLSAEQTCYKNGKADWSDTRDVYGKKAGRRLKN